MVATDRFDVVVVGGGVIGCAVARELAPDHDVLVLEAGSAGGETSPKASGLMTIVADLPGFPAAARHAVDFFRDYDGTGQFDVTWRPGIELVTEERAAWGRELATTKRSEGFDATYLTAAEIETRYPDSLALDEFAGGVEFAEAGWLDPYTYTMTLKADAERRGARYETDATVSAVVVEDGSVTGVAVDGDTIRADHVVCATGWRTRDLLSEHLEVPVRPFRWQTVNLDVERAFGDDFPMAWDRQSRMYWRPEHNGDLHVGGGSYFVENAGDVRTTITERFRTAVAGTMPERVQDLGTARFTSEDGCPTGDAATPDDLPIIDAPAEGPAGLVLAVTGPVGGIMCSPFVSTAVRSLVTGESTSVPVEPFELARFEDRSADFDCYYVHGRQAPQ